ncbi:hypothetical protein OG413_44550 [Streptomyces sp. NBC_01433]|uniref:hypothetical protein n=1 Tax=Streptomyces sp. NBC_01433 TaxID=2903864 RepID=UPI002258CD40|nr:hypothetical protein [Streptomyces sp. NBC_01433]MCX4682256.1 hypothetical protein [Streptomyces sp. NBC_01433]
MDKSEHAGPAPVRRLRFARLRRLLWRGAGGGKPLAELSTARAVCRAMLFTLLAVSLVGTLLTTIYLPAPWGRLLVLPAAVGAFCTGIAACLYAALASFSVIEAAHRRAAATSAAVKQNVARRKQARTAAAPE